MNIRIIIIALITLFVLSLIFRKQIQNIKLWWIGSKLRRALKKKEKKRLKLKHELITDLRKYLRLNGISEYIPWDYKSREKIRTYVEATYGEQLQKLDINYRISKKGGFKFL